MQYIVNKKNVTYRILDGETIVINLKNSYFYSLNKPATFIWNLLAEKELPLDKIIKITALHYQKNEKEINKGIEKAIAGLTKEHLLATNNNKIAIVSDETGIKGTTPSGKYEPPQFRKYEKLEKLIVASV